MERNVNPAGVTKEKTTGGRATFSPLSPTSGELLPVSCRAAGFGSIAIGAGLSGKTIN